MKKTKILGIALAAAMITSAASMTAFAMAENADIANIKLGITGSFCGWAGDDIPMADDDGDGVYEGVITLDNVTADMIGEAMYDDGTGTKQSRGFSGVTFKVRGDGQWADSWGDFEAPYNRTYNSQTDCAVEAKEGDSIKITVTLDTNKIEDQSEFEKDDRYELGGDDTFNVWPVRYTVEKIDTPVEESSETPVEESSETPVEESSETPVEESSSTPVEESSEDSKPISTGDTTSAVALVAVVMASLAVAVVMTKKASSKE